MSDFLAVAAVTATLQKLIEDAVTADVDNAARVLTGTPDKAEDAHNRLNLFLYDTAIDGALRNQQEFPGQIRRGESSAPPLPLTLRYLITAHGLEGDHGDDRAHRLLARAMLVLHDHPVLGAEEIKNALAGTDLWQQVERVRIAPQPLTLDDLSKLWSALQTPFRLGAAYEVSVLLIESRLPKRTPLPVLTIGPNDSGVVAQPSLLLPFPTLTDLELPAMTNALDPQPRQPSAVLGDSITLKGYRLDGSTVEVRLNNPRLDRPNVILPGVADVSDTAVSFEIPSTGLAPSEWVAGIYSVSVAVTDGGETHLTNEMSVAISPRVVSVTPANVAAGDVTLSVRFRPQTREEQRLRLLFGDREIAPEALAVAPAPNAEEVRAFIVRDAAPGEYFVRLRVDGVDSRLIEYFAPAPGSPPRPRFHPVLRVTVT